MIHLLARLRWEAFQHVVKAVLRLNSAEKPDLSEIALPAISKLVNVLLQQQTRLLIKTSPQQIQLLIYLQNILH